MFQRDYDESRSKKPLAIGAAAAVLGAGLLAGGWALGRSSNGEPTTNQPPSSPASAGPAASSAATSAAAAPTSRCKLTGTDQAIPTEGIKNVTWERVGAPGRQTDVVPVSKEYGPGITRKDGTAACYSHTPTGAILAALNTATRHDMSVPGWKKLVAEQFVPGPNADGSLTKEHKPLPASTKPAEVVGFRVDQYSQSTATITFVLRHKSTSFGCSTNVMWTDGDWKFQAIKPGQTMLCQDGAPDSYVPWSAS